LPARDKWTLKGELEKLSTPKGLPNPVGLFNTIPVQDGKIVLCELGLENLGIDPKNLHDERIEIKRVPHF